MERQVFAGLRSRREMTLPSDSKPMGFQFLSPRRDNIIRPISGVGGVRRSRGGRSRTGGCPGRSTESPLRAACALPRINYRPIRYPPSPSCVRRIFNRSAGAPTSRRSACSRAHARVAFAYKALVVRQYFTPAHARASTSRDPWEGGGASTAKGTKVAGSRGNPGSCRLPQVHPRERERERGTAVPVCAPARSREMAVISYGYACI